MPNLHESRLRAMLAPNSTADWNLNAEDRAAISWALDTMIAMKNEKAAYADQYIEATKANWQLRENVKKALEALWLSVSR